MCIRRHKNELSWRCPHWELGHNLLQSITFYGKVNFKMKTRRRRWTALVWNNIWPEVTEHWASEAKFIWLPIKVKYLNQYFADFIAQTDSQISHRIFLFQKWSGRKYIGGLRKTIKSEQQKTAHIQKLAINKKSTIFVQSFWNLVKILPHEAIIFPKFHEDWTKNCGFFINGQFLNVCRFLLLRLYF